MMPWVLGKDKSRNCLHLSIHGSHDHQSQLCFLGTLDEIWGPYHGAHQVPHNLTPGHPLPLLCLLRPHSCFIPQLSHVSYVGSVLFLTAPGVFCQDWCSVCFSLCLCLRPFPLLLTHTPGMLIWILTWCSTSKSCTALVEDLSSVPSTYVKWLTIVFNSSFWGLHKYLHPSTHTHIHTIASKINLKKIKLKINLHQSYSDLWLSFPILCWSFLAYYKILFSLITLAYCGSPFYNISFMRAKIFVSFTDLKYPGKYLIQRRNLVHI